MTSLPATYIAPLLTMKVSQQRRSPLANINFISLCSVTKVYCVIINRILPASSAGQRRAMAVAYIVLGVFSTTPEELFIWKSMAPGRSVILDAG